MGQGNLEKPPRFCPNCGAPTTPGLSHCTACGHSLADPEELARLWGQEPGRSPFDDSEVIDLYPDDNASLQTTTPFTQTRPFDPADRPSALDEPPPTSKKTTDAWSSAGGTLSSQKTEATQLSPAPAATRSGPSGCLLGGFAILLIATVGALLSWGAVRPYISNQIEDEITVGISNQLRSADRITAPESGRIRITADKVNADLKRNRQLYQPVKNATVTMQSGQVSIEFDLYGLTSTYRCSLAVKDGRVIVVEPSLSGPAGRIVDAEAIGNVFEAEVAELVRRSNLQPTDISLRDGSIVVTLAPAT
jgi:hypothetical protein